MLTGPLFGLSPVLSGCSDQTTDDGSIRGKVAIYVATMDDGTSQKEFRLQIGGDEADERRLFFKGEPDLTGGSEIKVWGAVDASGITVDRFELVGSGSSDGLGTSQEAIIDGTPYAARTFAYVLVNVANNAGTYTESAATIDMFGTGASDASVKQWFLESSYGRQDLSGRVLTGFTYTMNGCDTSGLASALRSQVNTAFGSTPQHYLWYFLSNIGSCGWSGLAQLGSGSSPARDSWYNNSNGCVVLVQEPAHNFGMQHSSSLRCGSSIFIDNPASCTHDEYGDRHDPMGGGCRHTNAWQKAYQGWFGGCNSVRVNTSGTFTLHPLEVECNGIQVLQVPMPATRTIPRSGGGGNPSNDPVQFYYIELRTRTGFDNSTQAPYPTVLVHVGPDYRARTQGGLHTWILDMNPATTGTSSFDGMTVGQTFTDPAGGVSFTAQAISATNATISVTVPTNTANTCAGGGTLTPPGPSTCTGTGGTGGMGGMGGMAGTAGTAGSAGRGGAGAGGVGGTGGAAGNAGRGGGGAGGASGASGNAGRAGAGAGGASGASGNAGRSGAGAGGAGAGGASGASGNAGRSGAGAGGAGAGGASGGAGAGGAGAGGAPGGSGGDTGAGAGGMSGDGGMSGGGMSGDGGMSGGGMSGDAGMSGAGGFAGNAGAAGSAGAAGVAGGAGLAGAGNAGAAGTGGAAAGAAGAAGAAAGAGAVAGTGFVPPGGDADDDAGCTCRIEQARPEHEATLWLGLLGVLAGGIARRRQTSRGQYKPLVK